MEQKNFNEENADRELVNFAKRIAQYTRCEAFVYKPKTGARRTRKIVIRMKDKPKFSVVIWTTIDDFGYKDLATAAIKYLLLHKDSKNPICRFTKTPRKIKDDQLEEVTIKSACEKVMDIISIARNWWECSDHSDQLSRLYYNSTESKYFWQCETCKRKGMPASRIQKALKERVSTKFWNMIRV